MTHAQLNVAIDIYISLTTIPGRSNTLRNTIIQLLKQDYPNIKAFIITIPTVNMRGLSFATDIEDDYKWLEALDTTRRIIVNRPEYDYGPCMKFIGAVPFLSATSKADTWVFVCDDDQMYLENRISSQVAQIKSPKHIVARATNLILQNFHPSFFGPMGFTGMLLPKQAIFEIDSFIRTRQKDIPRCCKMNDDILIGTILYNAGYYFTADKHTKLEEVFVEGVHGYGENALASSYKNGAAKFFAMYTCHLHYNRRNAVGVVAILLTVFIIIVTLAIAIPIAFSRRK